MTRRPSATTPLLALTLACSALPAAAADAIVGRWQCQMLYSGVAIGQGSIAFSADGRAEVGGRPFTYQLLDGQIVRLTDETGTSDYRYTTGGGNLQLSYSDGSAFACVRQEAATAPGVAPPGGEQAAGAQPQSDTWQLQGTYCHWSGSSSSYGNSSYSRSEKITFDGQGRWSMGSEASFSGNAGMGYSGGGNRWGGTYRIAGGAVHYQTETGEQGVAQIQMQQDDGRITEILVDGKLYAPQLCE